MSEFKGFDDWIPIFRGGKQTDSSGREHDGDALIEKALAAFDVTKHEPPAVIGHPADNAPAYGWVERLKKEGKLLLAKFRQVVPEFEDMVKRGLFKKRSASFYPDGTLRHVGFLGAMPPAVKGLPDAFAEFADGETITFDFSEEWKMQSISDVFRRLREWLIEKDGQETADRVVPNWTIEDIWAAPTADAAESEIQPTHYKEENMFKEKLKNFLSFMGVDISKVPDEALPVNPPQGSAFTEADIETAKKQAAEEAARKEREKVTAEFAEKDRQARETGRKGDIAAWCEQKVKEGRLTPALVKFGVPEILNFLAASEDVIEFGETKEKATLYDRFKAMFETELPKLIEFKEIATRDKDAGGAGGAGQKLSAIVHQKMKDNKELTYAAAFSEAQRENPDLATEYAAEFREVN